MTLMEWLYLLAFGFAYAWGAMHLTRWADRWLTARENAGDQAPNAKLPDLSTLRQRANKRGQEVGE